MWADSLALSLSIAAVGISLLGAYLNWRQIRVQQSQFRTQLASQEVQFAEQLRAEAAKITRLEAVVEQLQRQTKAQEDQVRLTEQQNRLLAEGTSVQREQLERDKRPLLKKIWHGLVGE